MRKVVSLVVLFSLVSNLAIAECDFSTGITKLEDGNYKYTKECHVKVGEIKRDLDIANEQVGSYKKAIELKDLALTKLDQRADMWRDTAFKLEDRINTIDSLKGKNDALYFGLGVLTAIGAAWAASRLIHP